MARFNEQQFQRGHSRQPVRCEGLEVAKITVRKPKEDENKAAGERIFERSAVNRKLGSVKGVFFLSSESSEMSITG